MITKLLLNNVGNLVHCYGTTEVGELVDMYADASTIQLNIIFTQVKCSGFLCWVNVNEYSFRIEYFWDLIINGENVHDREAMEEKLSILYPSRKIQ